MRLTNENRTKLQTAVGSDEYDGSVASRARIVLLLDSGCSKSEIAKMMKTTRPTVDKWLKRYADHGIEGLVDRESPGSPRQIPDRIRSRVLAVTRTSPPKELGISHWTTSEMTKFIKKTEGVYVSPTWVARLWREHHLQPWRQGTFKISKDPQFEEKVRDVVGLYLDPPEDEVVVSVDAKTGIQALDRTQPLLPVSFGKTEKRTHDYKRAGTIDMYAALDVRTGKVMVELAPTHTSADFLRLMKKVTAANPGKKVHVILDNASSHTSEEVEKWLGKQGGQVVFHFTPTGASWMNMIEIWNGIITRKSIRLGTHSSVKVLARDILAFTEHWNADCQPFEWTVTAEDILQKVKVISSNMARLERAVVITDVTAQAA
jgi:transposase